MSDDHGGLTMTTTADAPSATHGNGRPAIDPIDLEVLRTRLEAIGEQAAAAVEHTAISPTVTESKDYSVTILDAAGRPDRRHRAWSCSTSGRRRTRCSSTHRALRRHDRRRATCSSPTTRTTAAGCIPRTSWSSGRSSSTAIWSAWVVMSAHMMDMGGMVVGSFAPQATECYQEGLRLPAGPAVPPGRGESPMSGTSSATTSACPTLVEMDLRGLVAGCHSPRSKWSAWSTAWVATASSTASGAIRDLTEAEMRRRIARPGGRHLPVHLSGPSTATSSTRSPAR